MSKQNDLMTISVDDVVRTLAQDVFFDSDAVFWKVMGFASELTGISEDRLMDLVNIERKLVGKLDDRFEMRVVERWGDYDDGVVYGVEIAPGKFVDVWAHEDGEVKFLCGLVPTNNPFEHVYDDVDRFIEGVVEFDMEKALRTVKEYIKDSMGVSPEFVLSEDTDFGADLMAFISDWREDLGFSSDDVAKARKNVCFGVIAMDVQEYLMETDCSLDDIDMGRYTLDERVMDLVHIVARAYQDYLDGNYTESTVKRFVESFREEKGTAVASVLGDAQLRSATMEARSASDRMIERLWDELEDVPVDENECLDVDWNGWSKGTHREEIWHWFDERHSKGVGWLMNEYEPENNLGIGKD